MTIGELQIAKSGKDGALVCNLVGVAEDVRAFVDVVLGSTLIDKVLASRHGDSRSSSAQQRHDGTMSPQALIATGKLTTKNLVRFF